MQMSAPEPWPMRIAFFVLLHRGSSGGPPPWSQPCKPFGSMARKVDVISCQRRNNPIRSHLSQVGSSLSRLKFSRIRQICFRRVLVVGLSPG